ncbi:putative 1-acyl-sn-glycerol-3-phosphate acyltransferase 5 isoform B [Glycine soja]|uniref:Putative 1-acyl-sn-glycerol-3-phosphate acyltransferase 5 isoform B n=1 Tax=Glycine soja TaxID=3848 RepID=A0A445HKG8_GLYSO|nr:putative 1-acyl-sn-glycerol-3-phosphate acyltransferase 5 isoform B [Glycine soja]
MLEDGEGYLGTMIFNIRIMTLSLEAMEVWAAVVQVWVAASLIMAISRRSTQATESSVSAIEEWQVEPIVRLLTLVFEIKEISVKQRKQESEKERILNIFLPVDNYLYDRYNLTHRPLCFVHLNVSLGLTKCHKLEQRYIHFVPKLSKIILLLGHQLQGQNSWQSPAVLCLHQYKKPGGQSNFFMKVPSFANPGYMLAIH